VANTAEEQRKEIKVPASEGGSFYREVERPAKGSPMIGVDKVLAAKEERTRLRKEKEAQRRQRLEEPGPSVYERVWSTDEEEDLKKWKRKKACPQLLRLHHQTPAKGMSNQFFCLYEESLCGKGSVSLVVHWDGKLLQDLTGKEHVDRLTVLVSGHEVNKLLGVPKLTSGTGENTAAAVYTLLQDWSIADRVKAMFFDTSLSNTGHRAGACNLLEQKLERDILYLACRHHFMELILAAAFKAVMGVTCCSTP